MSVFLSLVGLSLVDAAAFLRMATAANDAILSVFSNGFAGAAFVFVLTCIWAAFSPLGKVRIGGEDATPLLSRWAWMTITLTTTIAIGIVFWATAEPLYHLYAPGGTGIEPGSEAAARFSMASLYMHWSFTPYAIYTIPGLTFALVYYNLRQPFSLGSPLAVLVGRPLPRWAGDGLDGLALLALLLGLAASLGAGILSISGGVARVSGWSSGPLLTGGVALIILAAFYLSSASGLQRGIRQLSDINTKVFILLIAFIFLAGPSWEILRFGGQSALQFAGEFLPRSTLREPFNDRDWLNDWTVFYFANWMAWAPLTGLFLGKISKGYRVREYILINLVLPACFSILWMTVFGGLALKTEMAAPQSLNAILQEGGPEFVLYAVLETLPLAGMLSVGVILISFLSYVTAADSNLHVITDLCQRDATKPARKATTLWLKLVWTIAVGAAAWVMVTLSGIDGIKMLSNLGGLPALFIISAFNITLIYIGTRKLVQLRTA